VQIEQQRWDLEALAQLKRREMVVAARPAVARADEFAATANPAPSITGDKALQLLFVRNKDTLS
jgi:hypothetical protein